MIKPPQELIDAFFDWYKGHRHSTNEDHYAGVFTQDNLAKMSRDAFVEFFFEFARDGGKLQSGGARTAGRFRRTMQERLDEFRAYALEPFQDGFDEVSWLERSKPFAGFGQGLATIYLNRIDKSRFAILNNKAAEAVELLGVDVPAGLGAGYRAVRDAERQLIEWYPEFENFYRADALSQFLIGEAVGKPWVARLRPESAQGETGCWLIAPGPHARLWDECYAGGIIGIGWDTIAEDLSNCASSEELEKRYYSAYGDAATKVDFRQLDDFVLGMQEGDHVFAKRGRTEIVGYGKVASRYYYDETRAELKHVRKVNWLKRGRWEIPEGTQKLPRKTITRERNADRTEILLSLIEGPQEATTPAPAEAAFTESSFELLKGLHGEPTAAFYNRHLNEFKTELEQPFQDLLKAVVETLPSSVTDLMETQKRLFSRIPKNDYGRGGAWPFYWGALYPKGGKRTADPQLFVGINDSLLHFGFYVGEYGGESTARFAGNCKRHAAVLKRLLEDSLSDESLIFGDYEGPREFRLPRPEDKLPSWDRWLATPEEAGIRAATVLSRSDVMATPRATLVGQIADVFQRLFPLILLAHYEDPLEHINRYLEAEPPEPTEMNPVYPLDQCAAETHFAQRELERWVRAIERKKQAIFYGPPGTGKTFIAERIGRHLIGGGDGFCETLQFHPAYAYEDFVQGLRPKAVSGHGLEYAMVPGRFKEFCSRARGCTDRCVLVIDEINRANLSRVLGELMYLLEYRNESVPLAGGDRFQIPANVRIIGTMNTADRSIALVDHALRRRFAFLALYPEYRILQEFHRDTEFDPTGLVRVLERLNDAINDAHYHVGISFFLLTEMAENIADVWQMEIEPYIKEFFFDQPDRATDFAWEKVRDEILG